MAENAPDAPSGPKVGAAKSFEDFSKTIPSMIIGSVVAVALAVLMMCFRIDAICCGLGMLMIALLLYYLPKLFGVKKWPFFIAIGLSFLIITLAVGGLWIGPKTVSDNDWHNGNDMGDYKNLVIEVDGDDLRISFDYDKLLEENHELRFRYTEVGYIQFNGFNYNIDTSFVTMETDEVPHDNLYHYECTTPAKNVGHKLIAFTIMEWDGEKYPGNIKEIRFENNATDDEVLTKCMIGAAWAAIPVTALYGIVCALMTIMQKNLEKQRSKMEEEGRLYPQGYNRCKECGAIVLPGEICCRKCGAYIEIPDEIKRKKVESIHCSECNAEIPEDATVCPKCGAKFDEDEEVVEIKPEEKQPEEPKEEEKKD